MEKIKKYQRVENYLNKLMLREDFELSDLGALKYKDISGAEGLEDIGDRTISNVLNDFKRKKGLEPKTDKITKKKKVEQYLSERMDSGDLTVNDLLKMRYQDLREIPELEDVGKTTLTCTLSNFKENYNTGSFEKVFLDVINQEKTTAETVAFESAGEIEINEVVEETQTVSSVNGFMNEEIMFIKKMIEEYKNGKGMNSEKHVFELRELKHALHHVGINPQKIVRLYWEDVSKDFMNQKILSNSLSANREMHLSRAI